MTALSTAADRAWIAPAGFVAAPQLGQEGDTARLAGTMLWFSQVQFLCRDAEGRGERHLVPLRDWPAFAARLPERAGLAVTRQFDKLTAARLPLMLGARTIPLDQPRIMAILNLTPDSFSDGGDLADKPEEAAAAGAAMAEAGAAIIDIGGESTRPGAPLVWEGDEIARVLPTIERLARAGVAVSIDTRKAAVMEAALGAGAAMVNDISALLYDDRSLDIVAATQVPVVLMHAPSQTSDPHATKAGGGHYDDVVTDVFDWLEARIASVVARGIDAARILVDPGIGFGKSLAHNLALINALPMFHALGCPVLLGASRKRLIGALSIEADVNQRLGGSIALATKAMEAGVQLLRVHDTAETVQAAQVWRGLRDAALTMRD